MSLGANEWIETEILIFFLLNLYILFDPPPQQICVIYIIRQAKVFLLKKKKTEIGIPCRNRQFKEKMQIENKQ